MHTSIGVNRFVSPDRDINWYKTPIVAVISHLSTAIITSYFDVNRHIWAALCEPLKSHKNVYNNGNNLIRDINSFNIYQIFEGVCPLFVTYHSLSSRWIPCRHTSINSCYLCFVIHSDKLALYKLLSYVT